MTFNNNQQQEISPRRFTLNQSLGGTKHCLYILITIFSFILFIISCVVVPYEKETYGGYNPPAAELAFTGAVGFFFTPVFIWAQRVRPDFFFNTFAADLGYCTFLWLFILGGVGALTSQTYDLPACQNLFICRGFSGMMAFSWLIWILVTIMIGFMLVILGQTWSKQLPIKFGSPLKQFYLNSLGEVEQFSDPTLPEKNHELPPQV